MKKRLILTEVYREQLTNNMLQPGDQIPVIEEVENSSIGCGLSEILVKPPDRVIQFPEEIQRLKKHAEEKAKCSRCRRNRYTRKDTNFEAEKGE
ncbi:hypothetical protein E5288_WYG006187 [Bos mutus]|uniref:Uncharacterized protein n=1 Tax=Bos mutus TaxID=72004 RepID=A0A6B0QYI4_9CETA|nr:hypothetical protein [Bos mutus]